MKNKTNFLDFKSKMYEFCTEVEESTDDSIVFTDFYNPKSAKNDCVIVVCNDIYVKEIVEVFDVKCKDGEVNVAKVSYKLDSGELEHYWFDVLTGFGMPKRAENAQTYEAAARKLVSGKRESVCLSALVKALIKHELNSCFYSPLQKELAQKFKKEFAL